MSDVPEAAAAPPVEPVAAAAALFGAQLGVARQFVVHLATSAVMRGLIGPREVPRLWERHLLNCASIAELIAPGATAVDVGSGAGLPGVAVAIARPDVEVTLVEPLQRRVAWLEEVVSDLRLGNVHILRGRAEEVRGQLVVDVAMARAVAALPVLAGWCLPLVRPGGELLALKGRSAEGELADSADKLAALGATGWRIVSCGVGILEEPTTVVAVTSGRSAGMAKAAKRPSPSSKRATPSRRRPGPEAGGPRKGARRSG